MRELMFDNIHTFEDWELILTDKKLDPPIPKITKIPVDGRDGDLDLSEILTGDIHYENRDCVFTFLLAEGSQSWREERLNEIINTLHGSNKKIITPDDPDHYLYGRCKVNNVVNNKAYASFIVEANCEPYRYLINEVNRVVTLSNSSLDIILTNAGRKTLIPTLIVSNSANIRINNSSIALGSGTYKLPNFKLPNGVTTLSATGSGTLTISYREAVL